MRSFAVKEIVHSDKNQNKKIEYRMECKNQKNKNCLCENTDSPLQEYIRNNLLISLLQRISSCTSRYASMTLEAAAVVPLFLFAILQLASVFGFYQAQSKITASLHQTAKGLAQYGYLYESDMIQDYIGTQGEVPDELVQLAFSEVYVRSKVTSDLGETYLTQSPVRGGSMGILYAYSSIMENDIIDLVGAYTLEPLVGIIPTQSYCVSRARVHAWTGYDNESDSEEEDAYVYVAENGTVYHTSRNCTHIQLSIHSVTAQQLETISNSSGESYTICRYCVDPQMQLSSYYITEDGRRYHASLECGKIRRTIRMVHLSEVEGLPLCSRCA